MMRAARPLLRIPLLLPGMLCPRRTPGVYFLLYHKTSGSLPLPLDIPLPTFRRQMEYLHGTGRVIPFEAALTMLEHGEGEEEDRYVLTFDDGFGDFFSHALPVLSTLKLPCILYITTGFVEGDGAQVLSSAASSPAPPLTWDMLKRIRDTGLVAFGAHTHTHAELPALDDARALEELRHPRELIRERLGVEAEHFSYPRARWNERVDALVRGSYSSAAVAGWTKTSKEVFDRYRIERVPILRRDGWWYFLAKARGWSRFERLLYFSS